MIFFTADTHFFHANIIKYTGRPFRDVKEMDETLVKRWNETVSDKDDIFHLGDFAFLNKGDPKKLLKSLNGKTKILIRGNHDRSSEKMLDIGFDYVYDYHFILGSTHWIDMYHWPTMQQRKGATHRKSIYLSAHVHEKWKFSTMEGVEFNNAESCERRFRPVFINVGVDQWDFMPVSLEEIERTAAKRAFPNTVSRKSKESLPKMESNRGVAQ